MAYKYRNEVYFAKKRIQKNTKVAWIKIGQAKSALCRGQSLKTENYFISKHCSLPIVSEQTDKALRLKIESELRFLIMTKYQPLDTKGDDYFAVTPTQALEIENNFEFFVKNLLTFCS